VRRVQLLRDGLAEHPALDAAVSHALLRRVAAGEVPPTLRLYRPGATLAFGRLDRLRPGYDDAVAAARAHGFEPVQRLPGGHAAAYHPGCVLIEIIRPEPAVAEGIHRRFADGSALLAAALAMVGLVVEVGQRPGEYCPGGWSAHANGIKLAGPAQKSIRGASLWTAFVAVEDGARIRGVLAATYDALQLAWRHETAGAAADVIAGLRVSDVERALLDQLSRTEELELTDIGGDTVTLARRLVERHVVEHGP